MALDVKDGNGVNQTLKTTLDGPDHVPHHIVDNQPTGQATEVTLAAVLAKILAAPSTEAKQDAIITALGLLGTQTTLAAILAKIIAAPATEAKQDTQITGLSSLLAAILPTLSSFRSLTVNSTAQAVKAAAGELWGFNILNTDVDDIFVKFYNVAAGSVNPASDVPVLTLQVPGSGSIFQESACRLHAFSTAIAVRVSNASGDTATTVPATLPIIELKYS